MKTNIYLILAVVVMLVFGYFFKQESARQAEVKQLNAEKKQESTQEAPVAVSGAPSDLPSREAAEKAVIKEMAPKSPELAEIPEGDVEKLKGAFKEKSGLDLKDLRKNPNGTYDAVLAGGEEKRLEKAPLLKPRDAEKFRADYLSAANQGREPSLDARDQAEIQKFRSSLGD